MFLAFLALGIAIQPRRPAISNRFSRKIPLPKYYDNSFGCDMCKQVVKYVEQILVDTTVESEIATLVEQLCVSFPSPYDSLCKTAIETFLPSILQWVEQGLDSLDICAKIGLCDTTELVISNPPKYPKNSELCDMCTDLIQYVETLLQNETIEEEIDELAQNYCSSLSWPTRDICKSMIKTYLPSFLEWIGKDVDSLNICARIGVCDATKFKKTARKHKINYPTAIKTVSNADKCATCLELLDRVKIYLDNATVEEEIEENLKGYCSTLSWPMKDLCNSLVTQYIPTLITYVEQDLNSTQICSLVGYCTNTARKSKRISRINKIALPKYYDNSFGCDMCKQVVKYVEQILVDTTVESEIATLVEQLCVSFPSPYDSLCKTAIETFLPSILQWVEQGLDSLDICAKIGLCDTTELVISNPPKYPKNSELCDMCTDLIQYVETLLQNETIEEEIDELAQNYCSSLSWPTRDICKSMIKTYLPSFLEWIGKDVDSLNICARIGVCDATKFKKTARKHKINYPTAIKTVSNADKCATCLELLDRVKIYLDNATVEEEIEENLKGYCSTLSWPMKDLCNSLVTQYIPTLITYVEQDLNSTQICSLVGYCTNTARARRAKKSVETCQTCQKWFKWAEDKLDEVTVEGLWKLISEECPKVPYLSYFCQIINEQNIEKFASLILSALPPEQCCEWIKLC